MTKHDKKKNSEAADEGLLSLANALKICKCRVTVEHGRKDLSDYFTNEGSDVIVLAPSCEYEFESHIMLVGSRRLAEPVILYLSDYDEVAELVGLRTGAHDVLHANMSENVIAERIMAAHRRHTFNHGRTSDIAKNNSEGPLPAFFLDHDRNEFWIDDQKVEFSTTETNILETLLAGRGKIVAREELIAMLEKRQGRSVTLRSVDSHIKRIRKKIGNRNCKSELVKTVYGSGYRFAPM
ncbi:winged helix-turn-helix domain-containing protein [Pseudogemmobacter sp. W21_MBD1_M6]|uniref:winged helix family transcriptional regulator n=1 Tax=Pseudogemmobacter sp. W21_MBD1_M6 TaxID=3240271 RepID=UPI003F9CB1B4